MIRFLLFSLCALLPASTFAANILHIKGPQYWRGVEVTLERNLGPFEYAQVYRSVNKHGTPSRNIVVVARTAELTREATLEKAYRLNGTWFNLKSGGADFFFDYNPKSLRMESQDVTRFMGNDAVVEQYTLTSQGTKNTVHQISFPHGNRVYSIFYQGPVSSVKADLAGYLRYIDSLTDPQQKTVGSPSNAPKLTRTVLNPADIAEAVVKIERLNDEGDMVSRGTGFFVSKDGWILTNKHVVEMRHGVSGDLKVLMTNDQESVEEACTFTVDSGDILTVQDYDVALVFPKSTACPVEKYLAPIGHLAPTGSPAYVIGYPATDEGGDSLVSTVGRIVGRTMKDGKIQYLKIDAEGASGHSGSPVVNERGQVVGIATAISGNVNRGDGTYQHVNTFVVPSTRLLQQLPELPFYQEGGVAENSIPQGTWFTEFAEEFEDIGYLDAYDFDPSRPVQRWEFISLVIDLLGGADGTYDRQHFDDVPLTAEFFAHFEKAGEIGLVKGAGNCYGQGSCTASPYASINRAEAATLLLRAFALQAAESSPTFNDVSSSAWYSAGIKAASSVCVLKGDDGAARVRPGDTMNWAEMLVMLRRVHDDMQFPACTKRGNRSMPRAPSRGGMKKKQGMVLKQGVNTRACTRSAWQCQPFSSCNKEGKQKLKCTLVDTSCENPERTKPPFEIECVHGGGRAGGMIKRIQEARAHLELMQKIALKLSGSDALNAIDTIHQYEEAIEKYDGHIQGALQYRDWFQLKDAEIKFQEEWLERVYEKFYDIPHTHLLKTELEGEEEE